MSEQGIVLHSKDILPIILKNNIQDKIHIISCKLVCKSWYNILKGPLKFTWKDLMTIKTRNEAEFMINLIDQEKDDKNDDDIEDNEWQYYLLRKSIYNWNNIISIVFWMTGTW